MPDALDSVKALVADYRRFSKISETEDPSRAKRQSQVADNLETVIAELESARKRLRPLSSDFGDLSDLPEEVLQQLNLSKLDELDQQLRDIVASGDGAEVAINQIIIELWRRHKVSKSRTYIMNKLYRMGQKGTIYSVEGKKGVYYLPKTTAGAGFGGMGAFDDDLDSEIPF